MLHFNTPQGVTIFNTIASMQNKQRILAIALYVNDTSEQIVCALT